MPGATGHTALTSEMIFNMTLNCAIHFANTAFPHCRAKPFTPEQPRAPSLGRRSRISVLSPPCSGIQVSDEFHVHLQLVRDCTMAHLDQISGRILEEQCLQAGDLLSS
ncbi:uncharacterized protein WM294_009123 [Sarcoramphus papa]